MYRKSETPKRKHILQNKHLIGTGLLVQEIKLFIFQRKKKVKKTDIWLRLDYFSYLKKK